MGDLREVVIDPTVAVERIGTWPNVAVYLDLSSWTGADFFREEGIGYTTYVSDRARNWLERTAGEWVRFEQPLTR